MQYSLNTYGERWEKAEWDLYQCWNQVGDEDIYIAQQAARIDGLHNQFMMMDGCLTEASNEASMSHDYMVGLHYSVVELGGFLRFPFGVEPSQWVFMGNSAMGAGQYLNLVRQRAYVEAGETTEVQMTANQNTEETAESEEGTEDEITAARPLQNPDMTSMLEELKVEFRLALQRQEPQDATRLTHDVTNAGGYQEWSDRRYGAKLQQENWRSVLSVVRSGNAPGQDSKWHVLRPTLRTLQRRCMRKLNGFCERPAKSCWRCARNFQKCEAALRAVRFTIPRRSANHF